MMEGEIDAAFWMSLVGAALSAIAFAFAFADMVSK
jgi:hypothetical protein